MGLVGMWTTDCCEICGNEKERLNHRSTACLSCYVASGPDWVDQWLIDAVSTSASVIDLSLFKAQRDRLRREAPLFTRKKSHSRNAYKRIFQDHCATESDINIHRSYDAEAANLHSLTFYRITKENKKISYLK